MTDKSAPASPEYRNEVIFLKKDRIGNRAANFSTIGANSHSTQERAAGDFYATDPRAIDALEYAGKLPQSAKIWECAAGRGALSEALIGRGYEVISTDLYDRGYCGGGTDFLQTTELSAPCILTNPPYSKVTEFCTHAIALGAEEIYMFMKLQFLEGKRRYRELFSLYPPAEILQFVERLSAARNGDPAMYNRSSAIAFCWMIWREGYTGKPQVSWISADKDILSHAAAA
jgi:hypothetical protein